MVFKLPSIDIERIIKSINLQAATNLVVDAYYQQGYHGDFGSTAQFTMGISADNKPAATLHMPYYAPFMLYGRGPGKMPPAEPIENWMQQYGIDGSSWAIRKHIAEFGTKGNDFISPIMPQIKQIITDEMNKAFQNAIAENYS